ncbi:MAG: HRDC domain-containing protein [Desulfosarcina sp.]
MPPINPELQLVDDYVRTTGCNIFLTGKAGTGKTTFLHGLKKNCLKRLVVTAPTGVAAINAGGVTLHSFFQLPFGPFMPGGQTSRSPYRFSRDKIAMIKNLDLLIIDEISMVRADLLDGVDSVLRRHRRSDLPFGGVQLLMIGDLFQLPPVVKDEEWRILEPHYASPYFFSSQALQQTDLVTIELQHIYRQSDSRFIGLLNRVRNDRFDRSTLAELNARHIPDFTPAGGDGTITLCTHNKSADAINDARLKALRGGIRHFEATIEGAFPEHTYPTAAVLDVKMDAQVMFIRNDLSPERRYFNGKIGTITGFSGRQIRVACPDDPEVITVEPATWENIEYTLDKETLKIIENKVGTFSQYPLRLAWAITIHKSQGLTFERAVIDAQAAFAHGQVYVALSRCRTLDGLVLSTPLSASAIKIDPAVRRFNDEVHQDQPTADALESAKIRYQQQLLMDCFDFRRLRGRMGHLVFLMLDNPGIVHGPGSDRIRNLRQSVQEEICKVGDNFRRQLQGLFSTVRLPAADAVVLDRIAKASVYFQRKLSSASVNTLLNLAIDTDNKTLRKRLVQARSLLQEEVDVKLAAVGCCDKGFSPSTYLRVVSAAATDADQPVKPSETVDWTESDIAHPEFFEVLKAWRSGKAQEEGKAHYQVLHQKTLIQIAVHLPDSLSALKRIKGIGKRLLQRYGAELIDMVAAYRREHGVDRVILPAPSGDQAPTAGEKSPRRDTRQTPG